jgi:hypothetical protein
VLPTARRGNSTVIAESKIDREVAIHAPIVLNEETPVARARADLVGNLNVCGVHFPEEETRKRITGVCNAWLAGDQRSDREVTGRSTITNLTVRTESSFCAELQRVLPSGP